jgi:hypothetical protein
MPLDPLLLERVTLSKGLDTPSHKSLLSGRELLKLDCTASDGQVRFGLCVNKTMNRIASPVSV